MAPKSRKGSKSTKSSKPTNSVASKPTKSSASPGQAAPSGPEPSSSTLDRDTSTSNEASTSFDSTSASRSARNLPVPAVKQCLLDQESLFKESQPSSSADGTIRPAQQTTRKALPDPFSDEALKTLLDENCKAVFASATELATRRNPFGDHVDMGELKKDWLGFMARHPATLLGINTHRDKAKPTTSDNDGAGDKEWDRIERMRKDLEEVDTGHPGYLDLSKARWLDGEGADTGNDEDDDGGSADSREDERRDSALASRSGHNDEIDEDGGDSRNDDHDGGDSTDDDHDSNSTDDGGGHKRLRLGSSSIL